jgi:hypothetical protein
MQHDSEIDADLVYLDKQLRTPQFEKQVLVRFHLTADETSFAIDPGCDERRVRFTPSL